MAWKQRIIVVAGGLAIAALSAQAAELKLSVPRRSHLTPVQKLNREGVDAVRKHDNRKAEAIFYKAYLLDPDDPFTLNNLGYVAELEGQVDRAQQFYALAAKQPTDAVIEHASSSRVQGHSISEAAAIPNTSIQINHDNVEAVRLLEQGRAHEVDDMLQQTLKRDPQNVFTLNNLGVAKEMEGESQEALRYYDTAASLHSDARAIVTPSRNWRGKPAYQMAEQNARRLQDRLESQNLELQLAELNLRGVSAINRNDLKAADQNFRNAYALDPYNAFALNNIGYLAELQGDQETAQFFYDKARLASGAGATVGLASRRSAEGAKLFEVARDSDEKVETKVDRERELRRQKRDPIVLRHRDNTPVNENEQDSNPAAPTPPQQ
jgi:Flp pilus assembly protein TadD